MAPDLETTNSMPADKATAAPLDDSLYSLDPDELVFFQSQTGIRNEEELKAHILGVQVRAYEVCIV